MTNKDASHEVTTHIKNQKLVKERRRQIVDGAVKLFIKKGYHKTTTRELARETGMSIGSLYEYVSTKEDVLYLVCIAIHSEVEQKNLLDPYLLHLVISSFALLPSSKDY